MTEEPALWRSIRDLTIADQLCTLAHREPLAGFAVWALEMSRNLAARDREAEANESNATRELEGEVR